MADAVFAAYNDNNTVMINSEYRCYTLQLKGSVVLSASQSGQWYYGPRADVTYTSQSGAVPLLAVKCSNQFLIVDWFRIAGNTFTWQIRGDAPLNGAVVDYLIFDMANVNPNRGGLFQLWDANGLLVFDSNLNYLKVVSFTPVSPQANFVGAANKVYAVINSSPSGKNVVTQGPPFNNTPPIQYPYEGGLSYTRAHRRNGNVVEFGEFRATDTMFVGEGGRGYNFTTTGYQSTMIVDVTGF